MHVSFFNIQGIIVYMLCDYNWVSKKMQKKFGRKCVKSLILKTTRHPFYFFNFSVFSTLSITGLPWLHFPFWRGNSVFPPLQNKNKLQNLWHFSCHLIKWVFPWSLTDIFYQAQDFFLLLLAYYELFLKRKHIHVSTNDPVSFLFLWWSVI